MKLTLCELGVADSDLLDTYSPFTQKIRTALDFHELPFESERRANPNAYRDINPLGQVPVLRADDEVVFDSTEILHFLEEHSTKSLVPDDPTDAALAWIMEEFADTTLNGYLVAARWADDDNWPAVRDAFFGDAPAAVRTLVANYLRRSIVKSLEGRDVWKGGRGLMRRRFYRLLLQLEKAAPESGFWIGDQLTVADVAIFGQLHSLRWELTPWYKNVIERQAKLSRYLDRIHAGEYARFELEAAE